MSRSTRNNCFICGAILVALYVGSYITISRQAFRYSDRFNIEGFYFIPPSNSSSYGLNRKLVMFYYPLIVLDIAIGTGRVPACEPMHHLSRLGADSRNAAFASPSPRSSRSITRYSGYNWSRERGVRRACEMLLLRAGAEDHRSFNGLHQFGDKKSHRGWKCSWRSEWFLSRSWDASFETLRKMYPMIQIAAKAKIGLSDLARRSRWGSW